MPPYWTSCGRRPDVTPFTYASGEEIRKGDHITYHGEQGEVEFVVAGLSGDPALDWYAKEFPGGGVMINATGFGSVFLGADDIDETLELTSRGPETIKP